MLITPSSWKRLEYGNFSLDREPLVKTVKVKVTVQYFS